MLKIRDLQKKYVDFCLNCSLDVKKGHITGVIGQNGAGKSTLFKIILQLLSFEEGSIKIFEKNIFQFTTKDKEKIGVVFSDSGFSDYLTINDLLPILSTFYEKFDKNQFIDKVKAFDLPVHKKIKDFSTGMKAKLKVLIATSHDAQLLVLDEPTAGLDVIARDEVLGLLRDFMEEKEERAILISSHIASDLETLCDDIYMIHKGKMIVHEETDVLLSEYGLLKLTEDQFVHLDKKYVMCFKKEAYGYSCLTNKKDFYLENFQNISVEKGAIDEVITMMIRGEKG